MFSQIVIPWKNLPKISLKDLPLSPFFFNNKLGDYIIPRRIIITVITVITILLSPRRSRSVRLLRMESRDGIKEPEPTVPGKG